MAKIEPERSLAVFEGKRIRKSWHGNEWWFVLEDIVSALTDSLDPKQYINKMRRRDESLSEGWVQIVHTLKIPTSGGQQNMNCVNTEGAFRIIQSIPSPRAEPFKLWLAKVGYDRVQEIQDPELAHKRMIDIYAQKGYSDEWIKHRLSIIANRQEVTDEWRKREIDNDSDFAILTNEIIKAAFGKTVDEYKGLKGLKKQNLRDHMNNLELIFTSLAEASTTAIARGKDTKGFKENKTAAKAGGAVAGNARKELEKKSGKPVVSRENYLEAPERVKRKRLR